MEVLPITSATLVLLNTLLGSPSLVSDTGAGFDVYAREVIQRTPDRVDVRKLYAVLQAQLRLRNFVFAAGDTAVSRPPIAPTVLVRALFEGETQPAPTCLEWILLLEALHRSFDLPFFVFEKIGVLQTGAIGHIVVGDAEGRTLFDALSTASPKPRDYRRISIQRLRAYEHNQYAIGALHSGAVERALESLDRGLALDPNNARLLGNRAQVQLLRARPHLAAADVAWAIRGQPRWSVLWCTLSEAYSALGERVLAEEAWGRAARLFPDHKCRRLWED